MDEAARRPSKQLAAWLGTVPAMRAERHFDGRIVRCFAARPRSTFDLLADAVSSNPDGEAIVFGEERLTYRQLARLVDGWADGLRGLDVMRGDRVAMLLGNGLAFPAVFFATQKLGSHCRSHQCTRTDARVSPTCSPTAAPRCSSMKASLAARLPAVSGDAPT